MIEIQYGSIAIHTPCGKALAKLVVDLPAKCEGYAVALLGHELSVCDGPISCAFELALYAAVGRAKSHGRDVLLGERERAFVRSVYDRDPCSPASLGNAATLRASGQAPYAAVALQFFRDVARTAGGAVERDACRTCLRCPRPASALGAGAAPI